MDMGAITTPPPSARPEMTAALMAETGLNADVLRDLVRRFYCRVRADAVLGPIFAARITDWAPHLDRMVNFWSSVALMTGVAGMLITGVLKMDEAYAAINWKTVFLMACLIPLGWAMDSSGAAAWVAAHSLDRLPEGTPHWLLEIALGLLTTAFSLVISHVGATIVMVPIAINLALASGSDPTSFALIVAL